jgi:hypothetical protein
MERASLLLMPINSGNCLEQTQPVKSVLIPAGGQFGSYLPTLQCRSRGCSVRLAVTLGFLTSQESS